MPRYSERGNSRRWASEVSRVLGQNGSGFGFSERPLAGLLRPQEKLNVEI